MLKLENLIPAIILGSIVYFLLPDRYYLMFPSLVLTFHEFVRAFNEIGKSVPIRNFFGSYFFLQFLLGPSIAYGALEGYPGFYAMVVDVDVYFGYALPAMLMFWLGLNWGQGNHSSESIKTQELSQLIQEHPNLPWLLIGIGFMAPFITSVVPVEFRFVVYLLSGLKFIGVGVFYLLNLPLKLYALVATVTSLFLGSLVSGMFHDLLTWLIMIGAYLALFYKPNVSIKLVFLSFFIGLSLVIQFTKQSYRQQLREDNIGVAVFGDEIEKTTELDDDNIVSNLESNLVRINQGWILSHAMQHVPNIEPFSDGDELKRVLEAAFFPRILVKDKLKAGDKTLLLQYANIKLSDNTSMGLGAPTDGYINFGVMGGCFFMFCLGWVYRWGLLWMMRNRAEYPLLYLIPALVYYFPIRPDCELHTALGHYVKTLLLIYILNTLLKSYLSIKQFRRQPKMVEYSLVT